MSKHFFVLLWMPLLFAVLFVSYNVYLIINEYTELEEFILERQVNYATDSAIAEMIEFSTIDADYAEGDFILVEPELALTDFTYCLAWDYGLDPTDKNLEYVQDRYIRTFMVCAYDGVYAYWMQNVKRDEYHLVQTPKIPYFYTDPNTGIQYALTMNPEKGYQDTGNSGTYQMQRYNIYKNPVNAEKQQSVINLDIENVLNWCLINSYSMGRTDMTVEIPSIGVDIRSGANSVMSPTVIAVVEGKRTVFGSIPLAESIGGSSVEDAVHAVGYTYDGTVAVDGIYLKGRYYGTTEWFERHVGWAGPEASAQYFDTVYDAAKAGYVDLSYID